MGTRFIHKNGKIIPIHSEHGDHQGDAKGQEATKPSSPSPMNSEHHHPAAIKEKASPALEHFLTKAGPSAVMSITEKDMPPKMLKHLKGD